MLAYKYMGLDALSACLQAHTVRFSKPSAFNDPFDCLASSEPTRGGPDIHLAGSSNTDKLFQIRNGIGVLSLTRNPLNPLLWAHYGGAHAGGVIAIDTAEAGLECSDSNIITASGGNVIYTSVRPTVDEGPLPYHHELTGKHDRQLLERLFLYKSVHWAYEEEIRVARRIDYSPQIRYEDFQIPPSSIKEIYLGAKFFETLLADHENRLPRLHWDLPECKRFMCRRDDRTWELHAEPYGSEQ